MVLVGGIFVVSLLYQSSLVQGMLSPSHQWHSAAALDVATLTRCSLMLSENGTLLYFVYLEKIVSSFAP